MLRCGEEGTLLWFIYYLKGGGRKKLKKRDGRKGGKFRTGHNHFRSVTMAPLNLLRDCHFCSSADEDSSEIQFYLVFQPVGTSELVPFIPVQILSFSLPLYRFPDPVAPLHQPDDPPRSVFALLLFATCTLQVVYKEKRINMVECKIKFIPLQISVISLTSRDSYIFVAAANPRDFDVFSDNWRRY